MDEAFTVDLAIDITAEVCPMTYVRTRLALDRLASGQVLSATMRGSDALRNVPANALRQGHTVLQTTLQADGSTRLLIRKR